LIIEANGKFYVTTWHAEAEMIEENITSEEIVGTLENGDPEESRSHANRWVYQYKNVVVIVNEESEQIIMVFRVEE
jgi:hypothetical protein